MTDLRFDDVVETTKMIGPAGRYCTSTCLSCSNQFKVTRKDFEKERSYDNSKYIPSSVTRDMLEYVSKMRAWNCCHEDEVPLDGLPEKVESPIGIEYR